MILAKPRVVIHSPYGSNEQEAAMSRHITDQKRNLHDCDHRMSVYTRKDRETQPNDSVVQSQRAKRMRGAARITAFTRIGRASA